MWSVGYYINHLIHLQLLLALATAADSSCARPKGPQARVPCAPFAEGRLNGCYVYFQADNYFLRGLEPRLSRLLTNDVNLLIQDGWVFGLYNWFLLWPITSREITLFCCTIVFHSAVFSIITPIKVNVSCFHLSRKARHICMAHFQ